MIEVNNLHKSFGKIQALKGISFQANDGEITGILGPNGAGKTTCLRTLYGLLNADQGSAFIDGVDASKDAISARAKIGIFPDKFGSYERLTVYEQVDYFASLHGMRGTHKHDAIQRILENLEMTELTQRKSAGFSQGQRMKVALAQALVHSPKNFILDEPTRGLDVISTRMLRKHLAKCKEKGHCILFSSHVMQEVEALCDRVVIIADGKVAAIGTTDEIRDMANERDLEEAFIKLISADKGATR